MQIEIISAIAKCLKKNGRDQANARQMNAIIEAANIVCAALDQPHQPAVANSGLQAWLASDETGLSSMYMAKKLSGHVPRTTDHPHDPSDFGRCVGLLEAVPEFRARVGELNDTKEWRALAAAWDELEALYREERPAGKAPRLCARMRELLEAA